MANLPNGTIARAFVTSTQLVADVVIGTVVVDGRNVDTHRRYFRSRGVLNSSGGIVGGTSSAKDLAARQSLKAEIERDFSVATEPAPDDSLARDIERGA